MLAIMLSESAFVLRFSKKINRRNFPRRLCVSFFSRMPTIPGRGMDSDVPTVPYHLYMVGHPLRTNFQLCCCHLFLPLRSDVNIPWQPPKLDHVHKQPKLRLEYNLSGTFLPVFVDFADRDNMPNLILEGGRRVVYLKKCVPQWFQRQRFTREKEECNCGRGLRFVVTDQTD